MKKSKSYRIPKKVVLEAYKKVKNNKGSMIQMISEILNQCLGDG